MSNIIPLATDRMSSVAIPVIWSDLYQITAPHFCAGLEVNQEICVHAAPILDNFVGRSFDKASECFRRKGWLVALVEPLREDGHQPGCAEGRENIRVLHPRGVELDED